MAKLGDFSILVIFLVLLLLSGSGGDAMVVNGQLAAQTTWCVAKPSSDDLTLQANLDYACSMIDCSILKEGGSCYNPNDLISHASTAMNLYYQSIGRNAAGCNFTGSGLISLTDPSYDGCHYP